MSNTELLVLVAEEATEVVNLYFRLLRNLPLESYAEINGCLGDVQTLEDKMTSLKSTLTKLNDGYWYT